MEPITLLCIGSIFICIALLLYVLATYCLYLLVKENEKIIGQLKTGLKHQGETIGMLIDDRKKN